MNRPLLGLLLGALLGAADGSTAYFTAVELRPEFAGIVAWSCVKGVITGLATGIAVRKLGSVWKAAAIGFGVALLLTVPVAVQNVQYYGNDSYYWKIIIPGAITGAMVGFATVRYGRSARRVTA